MNESDSRTVFEPSNQAVAARDAGMLDVAMSRQTQEVQGAIVMAKKFPRDQTKAFANIMTACKRLSLAEQALYVYQRGGQPVSGPSIRMAECLAQNWGNIDSGIVELDRGEEESVVLAYAWDLETNARSSKVFTVRHVRQSRAGTTRLTEERDIYETVANNGARRLRACILAIIPGDVVESAVTECDNTLKKKGDGPLIDRVRKMVIALAEVHVTQDMIEKRLGHNVDATTETELVTLRKIYVSLRDNFGSREQWFPDAVPSAAPAPAPKTSVPKKPTARNAGKVIDVKATKVEPAAAKPAETTPSAEAAPPAGTSAYSQIQALAKRDSITEAQIFQYARSNRLAEPTHSELGHLSEAKLTNMIKNWAVLAPVIKSIVVPQ